MSYFAKPAPAATDRAAGLGLRASVWVAWPAHRPADHHLPIRLQRQRAAAGHAMPLSCPPAPAPWRSTSGAPARSVTSPPLPARVSPLCSTAPPETHRSASPPPPRCHAASPASRGRRRAGPATARPRPALQVRPAAAHVQRRALAHTMAGASPALDSARALTLASGDTKVLLSVMARPRRDAGLRVDPAAVSACPPSASATAWATVSAPPVARSSAQAHVGQPRCPATCRRARPPARRPPPSPR